MRDQLREEIKSQLINGANPQRRFVPDELERDILIEDKLTKLFEEILHVPFWKKDKSTSYAKITRGDGSGLSRLKILAILILIPDDASLDGFITAMKKDFDGFPHDDDLPLDQKDANQHFRSPVIRQDFIDNQHIFLALRYKDTKTIVIQEEERRYHPDPIIGEPVHLGHGASGKVELIVIAKGHFEYENGSCNSEPLPLARKVFEKQDGMDSSDFEYFRNEDHISADIKKQDSTHKHLTMNRGSLIQKDGDTIISCTLFYDLASCNLWEILDGRKPQLEPPRNSFQGKAQLISQYCALVHALSYLHDGDIIHADIKPDNILVMKDFATDDPGYVWKLADWNLSVAKDEEDFLRSTSSFSGQRPLGTYQAPEVHGKEGSRVGWWTDLWSLGCIFLLVLAYVDDGVQGVKAFESHRREYGKDSNSSTTMDTFYNIEKKEAQLNPGVKKYMATLRERARRRDSSEHGEGHLVDEALKYLEEFVLVASSEERRKRKGDAKHGTRIFWERMDHVKKGYESAAGPSARPPPHFGSREPNGPTTESDDSRNLREHSSSSTSEERQTPSILSNTSASSSSSRECSNLCQLSYKEKPNVLEASKLLGAGERPDEICPRCELTPLHIAIEQNNKGSHMDLLDLYLRAGDCVDASCPDASGRTPLEIAVERGQYEPADLLLKCYEHRQFAVDFDALLAKQNDSDLRRLLQERRRTTPST